MSNLKIWKRVSNYSAILCGIFLIASRFFGKYIEQYDSIILVVGIVSAVVFLFSELMKFILKRKNNG